MKKIDYKVEKGKLIRLQVKFLENKIKYIKIYGDFFVYPETAIFAMEKFLIDKKIEEVDKLLTDFVKKENIKIIGFSPFDLKTALNYKENEI